MNLNNEHEVFSDHLLEHLITCWTMMRVILIFEDVCLNYFYNRFKLKNDNDIDIDIIDNI